MKRILCGALTAWLFNRRYAASLRETEGVVVMTLAITGGTGRYRHARGTMELRSRENGAEFAFVFHVSS